MLDARRLQVLSAVVEAGSVTAAAAGLGFTPSAVSQSIAALERDAGVALFEKAGRGIRPTQAGRLLAEHAEAVARQLREAEAALAALRAGQRGKLRLAAFGTAGANLVPQALALFRAAYPAVEMDLAMAETDEALARLRAGRIDLAIIAEHGVPESTSDRSLVHTRLLVDCYRAVVPRGHPLGGRRKVGLADLADEPWIVTSSPRCDSRQVVSAACARAGFTPRFVIEADEFTTTVGFVGAGLGVAMVPLLALGSVPESVRVRPVRAHAPVRYVYAVTRQEAGEQVAVRGMLAALAESARLAFPAGSAAGEAIAAAS